MGNEASDPIEEVSGDNDRLLTPLQQLRGIGPASAQKFARLSVHTIGDLLHHFPHRHEDLVIHGSIRDVPDGARRSIYGSIEEDPEWVYSGRGRWEARLTPEDDPHTKVVLHWYTGKYRAPVRGGWQGWLTGAIRRFHDIVIAHPVLFRAAEREPLPAGHGQIVSVYPSTDGLSQDLIRRSVQQILDEVELDWQGELPTLLGIERDLPSIYSGFHRPASSAECETCRSHLATIEMFLHATKQARTRAHRKAIEIERVVVSPEVERRILARLPYQLTAAQQRVVEEIRTDLQAGFPMARLVQGDVGSGKTAVAVWAMLAMAAQGRQSVLIAPTTSLAEQHRDTLQRYMEQSQVQIAHIATGCSSDIKETVARGDAKIVVGTTALLASSVTFDDLALVVVDEEQRFGVKQRQEIARKGRDVHRLHLSATPIPRSLSLALRGDFDLSRIDERPPGRPTVQTHWVSPSKWQPALEFLRKEIESGNRVLFVVPRIEDGDGDDPVGVEQLAKKLRESTLGSLGITVLHGGLSLQERSDRMQSFRKGREPVLVATSIVEVGLDVPELTVLWIEGAERFGLAQLHQLRGRVGRSDRPSWCFFTAQPTAEGGEERLQAFVDEDDGFLLAEQDLLIRGGGEVVGSRQSGSSGFLLARPLQDLQRFQQLSAEAGVRLEEGHDPPEGALLQRLGRYLGPEMVDPLD